MQEGTMKTVFRLETFEQFGKRTIAKARKLDRGEPFKAEKVISFESPFDLLEVLTQERVRLCEVARGKELSITALAQELNRDPRAVRTDIKKLQQHGMIRLREKVNPGHGRVRIVEPVAKKFYLQAEF
jgi:predicted transcriptional regulator